MFHLLIPNAYACDEQLRADTSRRCEVIARLDEHSVRGFMTHSDCESNTSINAESASAAVYLSQIGDYKSGGAVVSPPEPRRITTDSCTRRNGLREPNGAIVPTRTTDEVNAKCFSA